MAKKKLIKKNDIPEIEKIVIESKSLVENKVYKLKKAINKQYREGDIVPNDIAKRWINTFNTDGWFE